MLDYPALEAVAAVIREGSFERAAAALGVTPSAVSQRVRGLEDRLGVLLVIRGAPCRPTPAGSTVCAHVAAVALLENDALGQLPPLALSQSSAAAASTVIRVAVNADSLGAWFPEVVAGFAAAVGPRVRLDLVVDAEQHTAERLRAGEVLAAVTAEPAPAPGCRTRPLGALSYVAAASGDFAARRFPNGVTKEALAVAPTLRFDRRDDLQLRWARETFGATELAASHYAPTTQAFVDLALLGVGWAMNPIQLVQAHLSSGRLVDLAPGRRLDVPLYWQHVRLGSTLLERLTQEAMAVARRSLRPLADAI